MARALAEEALAEEERDEVAVRETAKEKGLAWPIPSTPSTQWYVVLVEVQ